MTPEQEDKFRLRKAAEHLTFCREQETQARRALVTACESTKRAKEKHDSLFIECENRACERIKASFNTP